MLAVALSSRMRGRRDSLRAVKGGRHKAAGMRVK